MCGRYGWLNWDIESFWKQNNGSYGVRKSYIGYVLWQWDVWVFIGGHYGGMGWNRMNYLSYRQMWWLHMVVGGVGHALGFVFGCVACIGCEVGCLIVECIWYGDIVRLVVRFGWVDIVVRFSNGVSLVFGRGFVVGRMMMKLVGVSRSNTSAQTQTMSL